MSAILHQLQLLGFNLCYFKFLYPFIKKKKKIFEALEHAKLCALKETCKN